MKLARMVTQSLYDVKVATMLSGQGCVFCLVRCHVLNGMVICEENLNLMHMKEKGKLS
jgi:hypothetical protein